MRLTRGAVAVLFLSIGCGPGEPPKELESGFSMATDSLSFANFTTGYDASEMDAALMTRMFGDGVCADSASPCRLKPAARSFMDRANRSMQGGRCEGFAVLSAMFEANKLSPMDFGAEHARDLTLPDNEALQRELAYWFSTQLVTDASGKGAKQYMAKDVMPALVEALKKDAKERWRIGIVRKKGKVISGGHALTPIGYYSDPSVKGVYWLRVYDNNQPDNERLMKIDVPNNRWEFEASENPKKASRLYYGDETNQNPLFLAPVLARHGTLPCSFCDESGGQTQVTTSGGVQAWVETTAGLVGVIDGQIEGSAFPSLSVPNDDSPAEFILSVPSASRLQLTLANPEDPENLDAFQSIEMASKDFTVSASEMRVTGNDKLAVADEGSTVTFSNESRTDLRLKSEVELNDGTTLAVEAVVTGGSSEVSTEINKDTGVVSVAADDAAGSLVTMVVTSTEPDGTETSGQITFTSEGDANVTADTTGLSDGTPLTGTVTNDGVTTTATDACLDGVKNGGESDVDCGSVCVAKCDIATSCNTGGDCSSTFCNASTRRCVFSSCEDTSVSGDETDVDCGGASCARCSLGKRCTATSDCGAGTACAGSVCVATWAVGFTVNGLPSTTQVVLQNNGGDEITVSGNGSFIFPTRVVGAYSVTIANQPDTALCSVSNGSGTATGNVSNVAINCQATWFLGGALTGLPSGQSVTLANGSDTLTLSGDQTFVFGARVTGAYSVVVQTQPSGVTCVVANGSGTASANVTNVTVTCPSSGWTVGGTVSGLPAGQSVTLANGSDTVTVSSNTSFTFSVRTPGPYAVTVQTQPTTALCNITNGGGTASANVTNVTVTCQPTWSVGGSVSGLPGGQSVTLANGAGTVTVSSNTSFTFSARTPGSYAVTVQAQPSGAFCSVTNGSGTASANVTNVSVTCQPAFTVGGTITGLPGGGASVTLANGPDTLTRSTNGAFTFAVGTPDFYSVVVQTQPTPVWCIITNGSGIASANVTDIIVTCRPSGTLDTAFNTTGSFVSSQSGASDYWHDFVVNPDGSLTLVGQSEVSGSDNDMIFSRVTPTGTIDTSFGMGGTGHQTVSNGVAYETATNIYFDPMGYIVTGTLAGVSNPDFGIVRITPNGTPDFFFGTGGLVTHDNGQWEYAEGSAVDAQGRYVLVGRRSASGSGPHDAVVARIHADGSIDTGFGTGGWVTYDAGGDEQARAVVIDPGTGDIVVIGSKDNDTLLLRYDSAGAPVNGFGSSGAAVLDLAGGSRNELMYDGLSDATGVLIVGEIDNGANADLLVARIGSNGALDPTFGSGGRLAIHRTGTEGGRTISHGLGGAWYVGGYHGNNMLVTRVLPGGTVDSSFATSGFFEQTFGSSGQALQVLVDPQGLVVAAGTIRTSGNQDLGVCRFTP